MGLLERNHAQIGEKSRFFLPQLKAGDFIYNTILTSISIFGYGHGIPFEISQNRHEPKGRFHFVLQLFFAFRDDSSAENASTIFCDFTERKNDFY